MSKFEIGDTVVFIGTGYAAEKGARAVVVDNSASPYIKLAWIRDGKDRNQNDGRYCPTDFMKETEEVKKNTIKLKPIQSEAKIECGQWNYVVLNSEGNALAMFVVEDDAKEYKEQYDYDNYTIREVNND